VTTGRILREESAVVHDLQGAPGVLAALEQWRSEILGLNRPPWLLVLTSGRDLDLGHPAFDAWARPLVFCPESAAAELRRDVAGTRTEVVGHAAPSLRAAIGHLRESRGARRISIEAGPSTAAEVYRSPLLIDELVLSVFLADCLPDGVADGELPQPSEIERLLGPVRGVFTAEQESGRWRYEHFGISTPSRERLPAERRAALS
jgi:hypothetical protein